MGLAVGAGASAQTPTGQMDKPMMKDGAMTVSGCVAAGTSADEFMLTNAMMSGKAMGKETMEKDKMGHPAMGEHMMSYQLVGGTNLKAHLGHKVEVMGTLSKMDMDMAAKKDMPNRMEKDKTTADKGMMKSMKLNVSSMKMISATCP